MKKEDVKEKIFNIIFKSGTTYHYNYNSIKNKHAELHDEIIRLTKFLPDDCTFSERMYCVMNDLTEKPKCVICETNTTMFMKYSRGYLKCCSYKCNSKLGKKTKLERYGDENYNNREKNSATRIENNSGDKMRETYKNTCLEKYGVPSHWMVPEIAEKRTKTILEKYGVNSVLGLPEVREKIKCTLLEKYGVDNVSFIPEVVEKIRNAQLNLTEQQKLENNQKLAKHLC